MNSEKLIIIKYQLFMSLELVDLSLSVVTCHVGVSVELSEQ